MLNINSLWRNWCNFAKKPVENLLIKRIITILCKKRYIWLKFTRNAKPFYGSALMPLMVFLMFSNPVLGGERFPGNIPASLALKIGERLYLSQKQGCGTCHQINGVGGTKAGAANLQKPSNWKSFLIAKNLKESGVDDETTRSVVVGLISNGAEKWNAEFYSRPEFSEVKEKIFFDKRMIGVHSSALKTNQKMAKRILRKKKKKVASKDLLKLMAESVYHYVETKIFLDSEK